MTLDEILAFPDEKYVNEAELAAAVGRDVNTLRRWAVERKGPPRTTIGRSVVYRVGAFRKWLLDQERDYGAEERGRRRKAA